MLQFVALDRRDALGNGMTQKKTDNGNKWQYSHWQVAEGSNRKRCRGAGAYATARVPACINQ